MTCLDPRSQALLGDVLGLLRTAMNGTSYTRNKQIHTGKIPSKMCPHCGEEDVVPHRIFHCAGFNDLRTLVSEPTWHFLRTQPPCAQLHGWMTEGTAARGYRQALQSIQGTTAVFEQVPDLSEHLHLFVGGSCLAPKTPCLRLATWGLPRPCYQIMFSIRYLQGEW